jgi:hypothetical protein
MFSGEIGAEIIKSVYEKSKTNNNKTLMAYSEKLLEVIEMITEVE